MWDDYDKADNAHGISEFSIFRVMLENPPCSGAVPWGISEMHATCLLAWAWLHLDFSSWRPGESFYNTLAHVPESSQTLFTISCS